MSDENKGFVIITGNSHPQLVELICERLDVRPGDIEIFNRTNRETHAEIMQSIRGKHIFIVQSGVQNDVNNAIFELLILTTRCQIVRRSSITLKLLAEMICSAGARRLISLDLYRKETQGFFSIPVDNLRASPFLIQYIVNNIPSYEDAVIIAKNPSVMNKATSYANRLSLPVAVIHGEVENGFEADDYDGRQSPPRETEVQYSNTFELLPILAARKGLPMHVVGDVNEKIAIIVDTIFDEASSFVTAADFLKTCGASKIYVVATHGLFSNDASRQIQNSIIEEVIVTNTVPRNWQNFECTKIKIVDISPIICEAIRRVFYNESLSTLFKNVTVHD